MKYLCWPHSILAGVAGCDDLWIAVCEYSLQKCKFLVSAILSRKFVNGSKPVNDDRSTT